MSTDDRGKLPSYEFHGVQFRGVSGGNHVADCPLCGKEDHFYVDAETGMYTCHKECGNGNLYTFFVKYHQRLFEETTLADYKILAKAKGIPANTLKKFELAWDPAFDRWLLPAFKINKAGNRIIANLYAWRYPDQDGKSKIWPTTGMIHSLINWDKLAKAPSHHSVMVCEGHWDTMALHWLAERNSKRNVQIVGVPGAKIFKPDWVGAMEQREVILIYDNDSDGRSGQDKATHLLTGLATRIFQIQWPVELAKGYDVRDFVVENKRKPAKSWKDLHSNLEVAKAEKVYQADVDVEEIPTFEEVISKCKETMHLDQNMIDGFAIVYATVLSAQIPGDPLWIFIVGPAGCGKTMSVRGMEKSPYVIFRSKLTPYTLVSGWRTDSGEDPSLLPLLNSKCLVLKDFTEVLTMPRADQEILYGTLRGAYDGRVEVQYGNGLFRRYDNTFFSLVAAVTPVIHSDNRASLGERFLKYEFVRSSNGHTVDHSKQVRAAMNNAIEMVTAEKGSQDLINRFISQKVDLKSLPRPPAWFFERIIGLSQIITYLRAAVKRKSGGDMPYRPQPEVGTRLAKQLMRLGMCLTQVFRTEFNERIYSIVEQVAFDTATGWSLDVVNVVMKHYPDCVKFQTLVAEAVIPHTTLKRRLDDLVHLQAIEQVQAPKKGRGRPEHAYRVSKIIEDLWIKAGLDKKVTHDSD